MLRDTARAVIVKDGRVLLMERWRKDPKTGKQLHYFSIPGGGIEKGETPGAAVVREVYEEMSIFVRPRELLAKTERHAGGHHYFYICDYLSGEPRLNPAGPEAKMQDRETHKPRWVSALELNGVINLHPDYRVIQKEIETRLN